MGAIAYTVTRAEETSMRDKSPRSQSEKFIEKARELGLGNMDASAADAVMGRLAKTPPEPKPATKNAAPKGGAVGDPKEPNPSYSRIGA